MDWQTGRCSLSPASCYTVFRTIDEADLHGRASREHWTVLAYFAAAMGLARLPGSGVATGHALIDSAAGPAGYSWLRRVFVFADGLTAGGRPARGHSNLFRLGRPGESTAPKHAEKPETDEGQQSTPATMFVPAATLTLAGLLRGFFPGMPDAVLQAAAQIQKTTISQTAPPFTKTDFAFCCADVIAAIAIPLTHIFSPRIAALTCRVTTPRQWLHRIHNGHVGD